MNKSCFILIVLAAVLMPAGRVFAQTDTLKNKFTLSLNLLAHGEMCGGGLPRESASVEDRSSFVFGRTRLVLDYERPHLQAYAVLQNSAVWGMKGNQALGLYEGWVKMHSTQGFFAQLGRVALSYDDERIIGTNEFATAALSHDVLRVGYEGHGHKVHAILAYNQNAENVYNGTYYNYKNGSQYYKTMQTLWYHYEVPVFPLGASLLFMNLGLQAGVQGNVNNPPRVEYQQYYGAYLKYHPKYVTVEASYYRQGGKVVDPNSLASLPIRAWMASTKATVEPSDRYGFLLGYDYLSGDDYVPVTYGGAMGLPRHPVEGGFMPLYGSRTKFCGIMDYFYESAYTNGFTPGLQNAYVGASGKPFTPLTCAAVYHYLAVATELKNLERTLGHSVELMVSYKFTKDISLTIGYTQMMGTDTMARLKKEGESGQARWGWFSFVVSPSIFSTKW